MPNTSDDARSPAVSELRAGDERAWTAFFARFDGTIRSIAAWPRWHFDPHTCEDVVQMIRVALVQSINRLQSEQALPAFVKRICVNRCIDMLRRQLREQDRLVALGHWNEDGDWDTLEIEAGPGFDPVHELQMDERARLIREALSRLDEAGQAYIRQFYIEGLSYKEMAMRQGVSINTVGSRLSRCLERLREVMDLGAIR